MSDEMLRVILWLRRRATTHAPYYESGAERKVECKYSREPRQEKILPIEFELSVRAEREITLLTAWIALLAVQSFYFLVLATRQPDSDRIKNNADQ